MNYTRSQTITNARVYAIHDIKKHILFGYYVTKTDKLKAINKGFESSIDKMTKVRKCDKEKNLTLSLFNKGHSEKTPFKGPTLQCLQEEMKQATELSGK